MRSIAELDAMKEELIFKFKKSYPNAPVDINFGVRYEFNSRLRTTLGKAYIISRKIQLNSTVLAEYPDKFDSTFAHELAHLVAVAAFGRSLGGGHGRGWSATMKAFGYPPERCHDLPLKVNRHPVLATARCKCREGISLKKKRLTNILNGTRYRCRTCREFLSLTDPDEALASCMNYELRRR